MCRSRCLASYGRSGLPKHGRDISTFVDVYSEAMTKGTAIACCGSLAADSLGDDEAAATAELFKALGDPARVRIVNLLATSHEPVCACELDDPLGLSQPTVSHHLKKLVDAGLLEREQRGRWAYFTLNRAAFDKLAAVADLKGAC